MALLSPFRIFLAAACSVALLSKQAPAPASAAPSMNKLRQPIVALSHGAGPLWLLNAPESGLWRGCDSAQSVAAIFSKLYKSDDELPKRILYISAHWESRSVGIEISKTAAPEMYYDYSGFPPETYDIVYPAKGDPKFAERVNNLLSENSIVSKLVDRPFDHGTFVPMMLIRPEADIPIVTMSINDRMLDARGHFNLGKALAPLRDEDTLIICSGQATHNMYADWNPDPDGPIEPWALEFQAWLDKTLSSSSTLSYEERLQSILEWKKAPHVKLAHRTPDHFTPFVVAAGAGMEEDRPAAKKLNGGWGLGHMSFASYAWGVDTNLSETVKDEL